jgi:hypothetical protein
VRSLFAAALALALSAPVLAQVPATETLTFEGLGTPIAYKPNEPVPVSARLKAVTLAGGGLVRFRTRGGAKYVALVTHFGTTGIVAVSKKGRIQIGRYLELRIRKSPGARFDSFVAIQANVRLVSDNGTPNDPADDVLAYDNPGDGAFRLFDEDGSLYPPNGGELQIFRTEPTPLVLVKDPYNLTTTSLDFARIQIRSGATVGALVLDDFVVSYGH